MTRPRPVVDRTLTTVVRPDASNKCQGGVDDEVFRLKPFGFDDACHTGTFGAYGITSSPAIASLNRVGLSELAVDPDVRGDQTDEAARNGPNERMGLTTTPTVVS